MRVAALALVTLVTLALACVSPRVKTDFDSDVDFADFETFEWLEPPLRDAPGEPADPAAHPFTHNTLLDKRVRTIVERALAERGYRPVAAGASPDFQLRYEIVTREVTRGVPGVVTGGRGYYGHHSSVSYHPPSSYQEGTLVLDVIDPGDARIAWRGWTEARTRDGFIPPDRLERYLERIVERFPPAPVRADDG